MRERYQFAQLLERAEVFLDAVKVLRVVTMETSAWLAVFEFNLVRMIVVVIPGRKPNGGDAEVLQIRQTIDHALKIAAVVPPSGRARR